MKNTISVLLLKDNYPLFHDLIWKTIKEKILENDNLKVIFNTIEKEETEELELHEKEFHELFGSDEYFVSDDLQFSIVMEKFLSKINRHHPEFINAICSIDGWEKVFRIEKIEEIQSNSHYSIISYDYPSGEYLIKPIDLKINCNSKDLLV